MIRLRQITLTVLLLFSITGYSQFLDGSIELKYLQGDFQGILYDAQEYGAIARYSEKSVIGKNQVVDLITVTSIKNYGSEYYPLYNYNKVEIGREADGQIRLVGEYYSMNNYYSGLYPIIEKYLLAFDAYNLFNWETPLELEFTKQSTYCHGDFEEFDQGGLKVDAFNQTIRFDSWRSMIKPKLDCEDARLTYTRFWSNSKMFIEFRKDIYNSPIPQSLQTKYFWSNVKYLQENPSLEGGQVYFDYRIEENLLAEILGFEDELFETVSLEPTSTDQFYITPKINGVNEYKMLFDTGASICTMSDSHQETFLMLGLVKETGQTIELVNADGVKSVKNIYICDMTIGAKNIEGIQIVFTSGTPLFGMNVLNQMDDWRIVGDNLIFKK